MEKMGKKSKKILMIGALVLLLVSALTVTVFASGEEAASPSNMYATFWSLIPPVIAIVLALITKEVYSSLFIGILAGGLFYANFNPANTIVAVTEVLTEKIADGWNAGILIFLVALGIMVSLMNKAGGSAAYGKWASQGIKTKRGALFSTFFLGIFIFIDDYFNCLTVGSVMKPVTDKQKISRAKLAYIIDATAAPVCIIAPISSWAAAVTSSATGDIDGFGMFLASIPYNLYAFLTIAMIIIISALNFDYGPMKRHERMAEEGDLFGGTGNEYAVTETPEGSKGKVIDLILPVVVLIASCIVGMIYTGGFFDGESFKDAFANSDASVGLALGSIVAILFTFVLYIPRRILSFKDFASCLPDGFRQMVPAILILSMAWTISGLCNDRLGAGEFVGSMVTGSATASSLLPAILFLIALGLAFATGTSWGTFGILIPIAMAIFPEMSEILIISISAVLAGAVCGDHISPISDTTIMASSGAQSNHIAHVSTQIPYALVVAGISFLGFILAGFVRNPVVPMAFGIVLLVAVLLVIRYVTQRSDPLSDMTIVKMPHPEEADKSSK
jgi:Na+/H+ antiporter NhaC